jgi:integrase
MRGYIKPNLNKDGKIISYRIAVSIGRDPVTKKPRHIYETFKRKGDADKRLNELVRRRENGMLFAPSRDSLGSYLENWLRDIVKPNLSPRTVEGYESIINKHIIPAKVGKIPLTQLKPPDIQGYYSDKLQSGLSNRTVLHHAMCLHGALRNAVKTGLVPFNICDATTPPKAVKKEMQIMNEKEMQIFLELARNTRYHTLFYLALFTGMRRGELLGLKWSDIDLLGMQISVNRSLYQLANGEIIITKPKTNKSRRLISLTPSTCEVIRDEYAKQKATQESLAAQWNEDSFVFSEWDGKHLLPNTISHAWQKLAKKAGMKGVRLHDSRHSHATLMLKAGIHPKIVSERLGHSSITITLDTYSHVVPGLQQAAANKFDELVLPRQNLNLAKQLEKI